MTKYMSRDQVPHNNFTVIARRRKKIWWWNSYRQYIVLVSIFLKWVDNNDWVHNIFAVGKTLLLYAMVTRWLVLLRTYQIVYPVWLWMLEMVHCVVDGIVVDIDSLVPAHCDYIPDKIRNIPVRTFCHSIWWKQNKSTSHLWFGTYCLIIVVLRSIYPWIHLNLWTLKAMLFTAWMGRFHP